MEHTAHHVDTKIPLYHLTSAQAAVEAVFARRM
jgi:fatty acid desaturase